MNENTFFSDRRHTRLSFEPLTVSCQLVCLTPMSPATQAVNTFLSPVEYEPDRSLTPTVIFPDVRAVDRDGIFSHGPANGHLAIDTMEWYVDGREIGTVWREGTDYEIVTDAGDTRGALRVKRNIEVSGKAVLSFKGRFNDFRTGLTYEVESDGMALTATDKGEDLLDCSVDRPVVEYDPLKDSLLLYDYKAANGLSVDGGRERYRDGRSFEQEVNVVLTAGATPLEALPQGVTMRLVKVGTTAPLTAGSEASPEVTRIEYPVVGFDMRMIDVAAYEVQFLKDGKIAARATIGLHTKVTMPDNGRPVMSTDLPPSQKEYFNRVLLNLADRQIEYPELYYMIVWKTQAMFNDSGTWKYAQEKTWQRGPGMVAPVEELGLGVTKDDSFFDVWAEADAHAKCELLADEAGAVLTDETGTMLID